MEIREDLIDYPEQDEIEWRVYLTEFREKVWPTMQEQGLTFSEALMLWRYERIVTLLSQILNELRSG